MFDWSFFVSILPKVAKGLEVTVELTLAGTGIAMLLGLLIELLRRSRFRVVRWSIRFVRDFIVNTPLLLQALFFFYVFPEYGLFKLSPFVSGIIVIGIQYSAYTAEVYRAGIDGVPSGQWQAARALNLSQADTWRRIILPQAIPPVLPALGNYLISMFKDTPQLLVIGVLEMMGVVTNIGSQTYKYTEPIVAAGMFFIILSFLSSLLVRRMERPGGIQLWKFISMPGRG
ncbi:MAG: ectoine/hydroxyectoine ABC transporter permease subunit EhuD [Marmoricola sp.]